MIFSAETLSVICAGDKIPESEVPRYYLPPGALALDRGNHRMNARVVAVAGNGDPKHILIPALEIIRYYGGTSESARLWLSMNFERAAKLFYDTSVSKVDGAEKIEVILRAGYPQGDGRLAVALATSHYARVQAASIFESYAMTRLGDEERPSRGSPWALPPFLGPAELEMVGTTFRSEGRERFLCYRITSTNFPVKVGVHFAREEFVEEETVEGSTPDISGVRLVGSRNKERSRTITSQEEPSRRSDKQRLVFGEQRFSDPFEYQDGGTRKIAHSRSVSLTVGSEDELQNLATGEGTYGESNSQRLSVSDETDREKQERKKRQ